MNDFSLWLSALYFSKLILYIAYAISIGGVSAILMIQRYQPQHLPFLSYATWGCLLGLIASSLGFILQVGSFAESGISGMWDTMYIDILWQSSVGMSYKLRLIAWAAMLLLLLALRFNSPLAKPIGYVYLAASIVIAVSFTWVGHTAEQATWVRLAIVLHIFIAMWWVGALYPLRHWCQVFPTNTLQLLMREFGKQASVLVTLLVIAGVGVSYALERNINNLFTSQHGNILLIKLGLVAAILALAAQHKFRVVPALKTNQSALSLKLSISIEMGFAGLILIVTAALSTMVGPSQL